MEIFIYIVVAALLGGLFGFYFYKWLLKAPAPGALPVSWGKLGQEITLLLVTLLVTGMFGWCLYELFFTPIPEANKAILNELTGSVGTLFVMVVNYWFGSSRSSAAKDATIADIAKS